MVKIRRKKLYPAFLFPFSIDFLPFLPGETTFVMSCLLYNTCLALQERGLLKLLFKYTPNQKGSKTILTEIPPLKVYQFPGPNCSKLTMPLVNVS